MMSESIRDGYKMTELGELPEEWEVTTIEKGCEILDNRRIPINSEERGKIKGNIPYYGANGIQDYINDYIFNEDLILLAEDGGYFDEFDNRPIAYTISGKSWVNNHAHILRVKNHMDNYFVFYNLVHKNILFYIKGGTRSKLNQSELKKIQFPFPPPPEQHRIAEILSTIDETRERTEALIEKYRHIKAGLMSDLLTRGIDEEGRIRSEETHEFKDSPLGRVSKGWDVTTLLNVVGDKNDLIIAGPFGSNLKVEDYRDEGIPIIRLQNIDFGKFLNKDIKYISPEKANELSYHSFIKGDIVLAKLGDPIGKTCIIPHFLKRGVVVSDVVRIRVDNTFSDKKFILQCLNSFSVFYQLNKDIIGTTRPRVNLDQVRNLFIPFPPLPEQHRISEILTATDTYIEKEQTYLNKLQQIKKGLMQDLLTGKVRVTPASPKSAEATT